MEDKGEAEWIVALHAQFTARGLVEAGYEAEEGGFAAAGRADDGDELTAADFQIEVVQGLDPGRKTKKREVLVESLRRRLAETPYRTKGQTLTSGVVGLVDKAMQAFFCRLKKPHPDDKKPGFPRFKPFKRFRSLEYRHLFEVAEVEVRVDLGGGDVGVAQQFLYGAEVGAAF